MPDTVTSPIVNRGLEGIVVDETAISDVDGQRCQLVYRGYNLDELVGKASYEEVSYLLLFGKLPTRPQLANWDKQLQSQRALDPALIVILKALPIQASSMALLRTMISALGLFDKDDVDDEPLSELQRRAVSAIAKTTTIVAAIGRLRAKQDPVAPKAGLSHAANFLYMLHGKEPSEVQTKALEAYFVMLADHGFNASTFTARTVVSTKSDFYSAVTAAIGSLKGPLHGAANRKAMEMLEEIGSPEKVEP